MEQASSFGYQNRSGPASSRCRDHRCSHKFKPRPARKRKNRILGFHADIFRISHFASEDIFTAKLSREPDVKELVVKQLTQGSVYEAI